MDYDYLNKLSEKELEYLNKFTEEYVNASVNTKNPKKNLHKSKRLIKDCFDRNNARNRDVLTQQKAMGKHVYLDEIVDMGREDTITALETRLDMELMGITDRNGNLLMKESEILQKTNRCSGNGRQPSKNTRTNTNRQQ